MENLFKIILLEERIVLDAAAAPVIYVNVHAAPGGDGSSWAHAFNNLQSALTLAASEAAGGASSETIWVADGTYKPNGGTNSSTFNLPNDVQIYGGFLGNETSLTQRNPLVNVTVLSGDLNGNDVQGNPATMTDNSYHVITASGVTVKLDGLLITGGNAAGSAHPDDRGGGLYATGANVTLNYMAFKYNSAAFNGGGIDVENFSTLSLTNSLITNNSQTIMAGGSVHGGGGLSLILGSTATISNTLFTNNFAGEDGAAIRLEVSSANISNSAMIDNHANLAGGGLATLEFFSVGLPTHININQTIFQNNTSAHSVGGAIFVGEFFGDPNSTISVLNSSFINNSAALFGGAFFGGNRATVFDNCNFIGNTAEIAGGAMLVDGSSDYFIGQPKDTVTVTNSNFINNTVIGDVNDFSLYEIFFPITVVSSVTGGGAIYQVNDTVLVIQNSNFTNNQVLHGDGGAMLLGGLNAVFIADNSSFAPGNTTTITNSAFVNNRADGNGSAIAAESAIPYTTPGAATLSLSSSTFKNNDASDKGGSLYLTDYTTTINANTFYKSNDAAVADQVYAKDTLLNGTDSGAAGANAALTMLNTFKSLDSDDLVLI